MSPVQIDLGPNAAEYVWINSLISISASAMLYYEYLLTLPREIQFLWPPNNKLGWFTFACLLNRYLPVLGHIPKLASYSMTVSVDFCEDLHVYDEWFVMLMQTHATTLCMLRVYALYGRSRRVLGVLLFFGAASIVTAILALFASRRAGGKVIPVLSSFAGCSQFTPSVGGQFAAIAWTGALLCDCLIFSLTLYKAFTMGSGIKLLDVIVRDGTMYFSALFIINLANIFTLRFSPPLLKTSTTTFTNVLSTTLVSRLVLNLRERNSSLVGLPTTVEMVWRFQERLPVARQPVTPVTSAGNPSIV